MIQLCPPSIRSSPQGVSSVDRSTGSPCKTLLTSKNRLTESLGTDNLLESNIGSSGPGNWHWSFLSSLEPWRLGLWPLGGVLVFELLSGFLAIECPIDRDAISVGSPVPGAGFRPENPDLAESALPQTLLGKEADLQFRLIQPTSVYRRVVNGEPIPQRPTLFLAEAVRQRLLGVGTQVVHDQMDG